MTCASASPNRFAATPPGARRRSYGITSRAASSRSRTASPASAPSWAILIGTPCPAQPGAATCPSYADLLLELRNHSPAYTRCAPTPTPRSPTPKKARSTGSKPESKVVTWPVAAPPPRWRPAGPVSLLHQGTVVLTSATLSTENDFSYICERLGLRIRRRIATVIAV